MLKGSVQEKIEISLTSERVDMIEINVERLCEDNSCEHRKEEISISSSTSLGIASFSLVCELLTAGAGGGRVHL